MTLADATGDELAGVVDLFGAVTRAELEDALAELAFKRGETVDDEAIEAAVDDAIAGYYLVPVDHDGTTLLAPGPAAFPALPEGAEDLPHILDVPDRGVDREALADAVLDRLRREAVTAIDEGDAERLETLADVTYDVEAWAPVDVGPVRTRILAEVDE